MARTPARPDKPTCSDEEGRCEDEVLKRMLNTLPKPKILKPAGKPRKWKGSQK
tara:strand:- start:183062 stop:183220 length:159 start_codon:yes stop_codon:yes gene_type:complete